MRILATTAMLAAFINPCAAAELVGAKTVDFVVVGDMPYNVPDDYARFEALIARINKIAPDFTFHVGDIKSGSSPCTNESFQRVKDEFAMFKSALVYTPGDNEWTDCHREKAGRFNPLERLSKLRAMFFADAKSLGKRPITLERQADVSPEFKAFVENARFTRNRVVFMTAHVVGSNNNLEARDPSAAAEFFQRDKANVAWIHDTFEKAIATNAPAMVIAFQAQVFEVNDPRPGLPGYSGFVGTVKAIEDGAKKFAKPVLIVHGDEHKFEIERMLGVDEKPLANVLRLQTPGESDIGAVRVLIDPDNPSVFTFQPILEWNQKPAN